MKKYSSSDIALRLIVVNTFKFGHTYGAERGCIKINPIILLGQTNEYKMFSKCKSLWKCHGVDSYNLKHSHCFLQEYLDQIDILKIDKEDKNIMKDVLVFISNIYRKVGWCPKTGPIEYYLFPGKFALNSV